MDSRAVSLEPVLVSDNAKGVFLAISSSIFIGGSFVIKKNALKKLQGKRARTLPWQSGGQSSFILCTLSFDGLRLHEMHTLTLKFTCFMCFHGRTIWVLAAGQPKPASLSQARGRLCLQVTVHFLWHGIYVDSLFF